MTYEARVENLNIKGVLPRWDYLDISCGVFDSPECRFQIFQSLGTFDQDVFELFPRSEVAQRDLFAVLFQRSGCLLCPPTRKRRVRDGYRGSKVDPPYSLIRACIDSIWVFKFCTASLSSSRPLSTALIVRDSESSSVNLTTYET